MVDPQREPSSGAQAQPVRVLTVDDHPVFRDAARALIDAMPGFELMGETASGEEALEFCAATCPDLVLLDIDLPGMDGLETGGLLSRHRDAPVIVLISVDDDPALNEVAAQRGASVFLSKSALSARALREVWRDRGPLTTPPSDRRA
jgi:two-component system, NarL family, nitrate/nitrite response regulator NarL